MITFTHKGDFKKVNGYFERLREIMRFGILDKYGRKGVEALSAATPVDTGRLASSWYYTIEHDKNGASLVWSNSDIEGGCNVAILIQYGHGTRNGGYVSGIDYINPALAPIMQEIADAAWKEVTSL